MFTELVFQFRHLIINLLILPPLLEPSIHEVCPVYLPSSLVRLFDETHSFSFEPFGLVAGLLGPLPFGSIFEFHNE